MSKLHVGCGGHRLDGWVNADLYPTNATDMVFDLQHPWPLDSDSVTEVLASHVLEHLTDHRMFFKEAHRVLQEDGCLNLRVPHGMHPAAWWDTTHVRPWVKEAFASLQPGYAEALGSTQHGFFDKPYFRVELIGVRLSKDILRLLRKRVVGRLLMPYVEHFALAVEELFVWLVALKTPEAVERWRKSGGHPQYLPCRYVGWKHHVEGRELAPGEQPTLTALQNSQCLNGYE